MHINIKKNDKEVTEVEVIEHKHENCQIKEDIKLKCIMRRMKKGYEISIENNRNSLNFSVDVLGTKTEALIFLGSKIKYQLNQIVDTTIICPVCEKHIDLGNKFCKYCGSIQNNNY